MNPSQDTRQYLQRFLLCCSCPIGLQIMNSPVTLPCAHSFQQSNLAEWLKKSRECPLCRVEIQMDQSTCKQNYNIKRACSYYQQQVSRLGKVRSTKRFQIFVKSQKIITIQIGDGESIESIMIKVALKRGLKQLTQNFPMKLYYAGKQLQSGFFVRDYGIQPHSTLLCDY